MRKRTKTFLSFALLILPCAPCFAQDAFLTPPKATQTAKATPLTPANAAEYFAEAGRDCHADGGRLWGVSLCGPMLFVDPTTRQVVASHPDADGRLKPAIDGTFTGEIPADQVIANTSAKWSGTHWIELVWPLPPNSVMDRVIMAHESYHRVQAEIVPIDLVGTNTQLQTVYGRYTMQLEWRALAAGLLTDTDTARRQAISDALLFRAARYQKFPMAQAREVALERDEGLAQYTGVMVGISTAAHRQAMVLDLLREGPDRPSFERSFAYVTGPAYGLLLNRHDPDWRKQITHSTQGLAGLIASALSIDLDHMPLSAVNERASQYGGPALMAAETAAKAKSDRILAHYRSLLVIGPVLVLPLDHTRKQFNPQNILSLGKVGTIYPTLRLLDDWGSIDVEKGALLAADEPRLIVSAPSGKVTTGTIHGPGWTLKLAPGWRMVPAPRKGDLTLQRKTPGATGRK